MKKVPKAETFLRSRGDEAQPFPSRDVDSSGLIYSRGGCCSVDLRAYLADAKNIAHFPIRFSLAHKFDGGRVFSAGLNFGNLVLRVLIFVVQHLKFLRVFISQNRILVKGVFRE